MAVFLGVAFGVSLTMPFVYQTVPAYLQTLGLPRAWIASAMTLGQLPEIVALATLPWFLRRFGQRGTLAIGIGAWVAYYAILAARPPLAVALLGIPLNGVAIACFLVAGQMFLDSQAPRDRRASAQALHAVITTGLGMLTGNVMAGELVSWTGGVSAETFLVPCLINAVLLAVVLVRFHPQNDPTDRDAAPGPLAGTTREPLARVSNPTGVGDRS